MFGANSNGGWLTCRVCLREGPKTRHVIFLEIPNLSIENFGASEGISNVYIEEHGGVW
jgi:hypothetical protein